MWKYLKEKALFFTWSTGPGVFLDLFFLFGLVEFLYKPWTMLLAFWSRDVRSSVCLPIVPTLKRLLQTSRLFLLPQCMQEPLAKHSAVLRPTLPGLLCAFPCAAQARKPKPTLLLLYLPLIRLQFWGRKWMTWFHSGLVSCAKQLSTTVAKYPEKISLGVSGMMAP